MSENVADKMRKAVHSREFSFRKLVAYTIFALIGVVFVFYGFVNQNMGSAGHAALVNNSIVTLAELEREQRRVEAMYRQFLGPNMDLSSQRQMLVQEAVQSLVSQRLISQAAQKEGLKVSNQEVIDFIIKDYPAFQVNGVFQRNLYYDTLQSNRITPVEFEEFIRANIESQRSRMAFEWASLPNSIEKEKQKSLKETQIILSFIKLSPRELEKTIKISASEAEKSLSQPDFFKRAEDEFKAQKNKYDQAEQVRAQHILIATKPGDVTSEKSALDKATKIHSQASKEDFGKLAEKNSDDPGSKTKKGDLGFFGRGQMVPEFEEVAFKMKEGEISPPVKSQFGYHIIKVNEKKGSVSAKFEDHKVEIAKTLIARDRFTQLRAQAEEVFKAGKEGEWIKTLGVSWKDTAAFDLATETLPDISPKIFEHLGELIKNSKSVKVIAEGDETYVVRMKEIKKANATAQDIGETLAQTRARELFGAWVDQYRSSVKVEINPEILKR